MKSNEIFYKWSNSNILRQYEIRLGIFSEKIINETKMNNIVYYLISVYIFLIEIQKHFSLIQNFLLRNSTNILFNTVQNLLEYITLEKYCCNDHNKFSTISFYSFLAVQLFILICLVSYLFFQDKEFFKSHFKCQKIFFNVINFILLVFPYSFNNFYLNLLFNPFLRDSLTNAIYIFNLFNFFLFHFMYLTYIYIYNDISPTKNKFFFSVTNPIYNILFFFRFFIYNLLLTSTYSSKNHSFLSMVIIYLAVNLYFTIFKVYFINRHYYYISIIKTVFLIWYLLFNVIFSFIGFDIFIYRYYILIISIVICVISIPGIENIRISKLYSIKNLNNVLFSNETLNEMYVYHLLSKKGLNQIDILKHKKLCNLFPIERCLCKSNDILETNNQKIIYGIKLSSCLIISKINKFSNNIDQVYIKFLLDNNYLHESLFLYYLNFSSTKISIYKQHLVIRNSYRFNELYVEYYNTSQNIHPKIKIHTISNILNYEEIFSSFLKNIKKTKNLSLKFWEVIKQSPINNTEFFKYGMEISNKVISICQEFGRMQSLQPNKIKLLKTYSNFISSVLHDKDYVVYLVNLIKENLQMVKLNINNIYNYNDKEFGLLVISGNPKNLFRILSYNKFSKQFLGPSSNLKNQEIHTLLPFPFNIIHKLYLKDNFIISILSKERKLFCLNHHGDLSYIHTNIIPIVNFQGNIIFYMLFYLSEEQRNSVIAYIDMNGFVFAATRKFKDEFKLDLNYSYENNSKMVQEFEKKISKDNIKIFNNINVLGKKNKYKIIYPMIFDLIQESKIILKDRIINKSDFPRNKIQKFSNKNKYISFKGLYFKDNMTSEIFLNYKQMKESKQSLKFDGNTESHRLINKKTSSEYISLASKSNKEVNNFNLNSNHINTLKIHRNKQNYEMEIKEVSSLSGYFHYYSVELKALNNKIYNLTTSIEISPSINKFKMLESREIKNNKISLYLFNYQKETLLFSPSKILRKIYYFFVLIFMTLILMSVYISWYNLKEYSKYRENNEVFNGFLFLEHKIVFLLMNVEYLAFNRYISNHNISNIIEENINYTKNSLQFDLTSLENFLQGFIKEDLSSSSSQFQDTLRSQTLRISYLSDNYLVYYSNYSLYQALNIYLNEIKTFINSGQYENKYFLNEFDNSSSPTNYEKSLYFLNNNFLNSLRFTFENNILFKTFLLEEDIKRNSILFNIQNIIFCSVFSILLIFLMLLLRDIYLIDSSLVYFYSRLDDIYIDNSYDYLKSSLSLPGTHEIDEKTILRRFKKIKKIYKTEKNGKRDQIQSDKKSNEIKSPLNSNEKCVTNSNTLTRESQVKLLITNENLQFFKSINKKESRFSFLISNLNFDDKQIYNYKKFYMKILVKAVLLILSLSYLYIIQVFIHPLSSYRIENYLIHQYTFHRKIIFNNMLVETLITSIRNNSTIFDINKVDIFQFYYKKVLEVNHNLSYIPRDEYFYNSEIKQIMNYYNSLYFCDFFFNNSSIEITNLKKEESYKDCISSPIYFGIEFYMSQLKNSLFTINNSFNNEKLRDIHFLKDLIGKNSIQFADIGLGLYSRKYIKDIHKSFLEYFNSITRLCYLLVELSFICFIIQLCIYGNVIYFFYRKKLHLHFEKKRILLSILPVDNTSNIMIHINNLLNKYF